ncbi:MAG: hypothetical protein Q9222_003914 [Ikaeria aurantiellina]
MAPPTDAPSLAMYLGKFWAPGRQLKISFLSGSDWQKSKVKQYAPIWCHGYFTNQRKASMNLGWINKNQQEQNLRQVILHEFGHALGAIHEHESPFASIPWNKDRVYKDLGGPPNNWDRAKVDQNMFTLYTLDKVEATAFDMNSIMLYHYPAEWTTNGKATPFNTDLSDGDKSYIHFVYPPASLDAGQFNTMEVRPSNQPREKTTKTKFLWKKYDHPPRIPFGLTSLDVGCDKNIRVIASAADIKQDKFTASLNSWADTVLYGASLTYLEAGPGFDYLRTGTFHTTEVSKWQDHKPQVSKRINFAHPFDGPPKTFATDIDAKGFTGHIETWDDSVLYQAGITWLAYPGNHPGVASGAFSTDDIRSSTKPQLENSATIKFQGAKFNKTPKVAMALTGLDYDHSKNLRLRLSTSAVTKDAMTWHLQSWSDSRMYRASASYFA